MARILLQEKGTLIKEIQLTGDATRIGREQFNHVRLTDPCVSRYHAEIHRRGFCYTLIDKKSTNGTRLNGTKLNKPVTLNPNDEIVLGDYTLTFLLDPTDSPMAVHPDTFDASATIIDLGSQLGAD